MVEWMDGWMDGWVGVWVGGWVDGWMVGWLDGYSEFTAFSLTILSLILFPLTWIILHSLMIMYTQVSCIIAFIISP